MPSRLIHNPILHPVRGIKHLNLPPHNLLPHLVPHVPLRANIRPPNPPRQNPLGRHNPQPIHPRRADQHPVKIPRKHRRLLQPLSPARATPLIIPRSLLPTIIRRHNLPRRLNFNMHPPIPPVPDASSREFQASGGGSQPSTRTALEGDVGTSRTTRQIGAGVVRLEKTPPQEGTCGSRRVVLAGWREADMRATFGKAKVVAVQLGVNARVEFMRTESMKARCGFILSQRGAVKELQANLRVCF